MATISAKELAVSRWRLVLDIGDTGQTSDTMDAVFQAIEDEWSSAQAQANLSAAIEAAAPGAFDNPQKKAIGDVWMWARAEKRLA